MKIVIIVIGGCITRILSDESLKVEVIDIDNLRESVSATTITEIIQESTKDLKDIY